MTDAGQSAPPIRAQKIDEHTVRDQILISIYGSC